MSKKCYRFFGGLLNTQEKWLNKMSEKGYRLVRTGKLLYEFEKCKTDEVTYCVEFIGEKSKESSIDYVWGDRIFEKCGIRRDEEGDGGKTPEIRGKRRLSARDGGANYQQS